MTGFRRMRSRWIAVAAVLLILVGLTPGPAYGLSSGTSVLAGRAGASPAGTVHEVDCPTSTQCWAIANGDGLIAGYNGGRFWKIQYDPAQGVGGSVSCPDTAHCWTNGTYSGGAQVYASGDGGRIWQSQGLPGLQPSSVFCSNSTHCWAIGGNGVTDSMEATTDGGTNWVALILPAGPTGKGTDTLSSIWYHGDDYCWAVVNYSRGSFSKTDVLYSSDGGDAWKVESVPSGVYLNFISCARGSITDCWALGSLNNSGYMIATTNGGLTWHAQTVPGQIYQLSAASCPTTIDCWVVGQTTNGNQTFGMIWATSNGGSTWTLQTATSLPPDSVSCPTTTDCWVGGGQAYIGMMMATTDGGATWSAQPLPKWG